ncbi:uncharacterized protein PFL1_03168 [Pseudozyma flocculosa PF-1]|uniref:Bacteriophage T5 Orf172 DNA-binding domain-containing protein n=2 Tax=Pseudozyma flocculosa TaxID=84751 RepID=A0A5C3F234_9BASI|nr:uncharacterized protein PFL1_03168 [Pseudozyma flocculosa PF-1]EPQ29413.1 hypothetical protein PFL1_03168 [Pseudozyma flocculosa PF-1]SPO37936.1 uncharacterized protein PSFLO_03413 [Pseudozyma flocculosa]
MPGIIPFDGAGSKPAFPWELVPARRQESAVAAEGSTAAPLGPRISSAPSSSKPLSGIRLEVRPTANGSTASTPKRKPRAQSASPAPANDSPITKTGMVTSPHQQPAKEQCWGIKQDGNRCTRRVKRINGVSSTARNKGAGKDKGRVTSTSTPVTDGSSNRRQDRAPIVIGDDSDDEHLRTSASARNRKGRAAVSPAVDDEGVLSSDDEAYCFQHVAEINKSSGIYVPSRGASAEVQVYVAFAEYLDAGRLSDHVQALLRKAMAEPSSAADLEERGYLYIYELRDRSDADRVCLKVGRAVNVFRRINQWRSQCQSKDPVLRAFFPSSQGQGLLSGADAPDSPGILLSHKWERLVHLELREVGEKVEEACQDCGSRHREIFMLPRRADPCGGFELAKAIVERWMRFVVAVNGGPV